MTREQDASSHLKMKTEVYTTKKYSQYQKTCLFSREKLAFRDDKQNLIPIKKTKQKKQNQTKTFSDKKNSIPSVFI